jgi:lysozyme
MTPSKACEDFIKSFEQCRLSAYMPTPKDKPTIGWGSTGPDIRLGMTWTQAQADTRFAADLAKFARGVTEALAGAPTSQHEFDAFTSLAYNIGLAAFRKSTALKRHREGKKIGAAEAILWWDKQGGETLRGLTRRRQAEKAMYLGRQP